MAGHEITVLLAQLRNGSREALHALLPLVYDELHEIARARLLGQAEGRTLTPTALVNEAYLKLFGRSQLDFRDRRHFFCVAARAMRQIVVDYARRRVALKRGGHDQRVSLDEAVFVTEDRHEDTLCVDEALKRLFDQDERLARVVELRFFGGFSVDEIGDLLGIDSRTVKRNWRTARALLYQSLEGSGP